MGIIGFGFRAIIEPLSNKLGWSCTLTSFANSLSRRRGILETR
jgi:hypothetical protein